MHYIKTNELVYLAILTYQLAGDTKNIYWNLYFSEQFTLPATKGWNKFTISNAR